MKRRKVAAGLRLARRVRKGCGLSRHRNAAGPRSSEYKQRFLTEGHIYFNWSGLLTDLGGLTDLDAFYQVFGDTYPDAKKGKVQNNARQGFQFSQKMQAGDWVAMPSKFNPTIHFGKITGPYRFDAAAEDRFQHSRAVEWFDQDIPRDRFNQDILYSLGAFLTVCRIQRNNAEERIKEMAANGWKVPENSKATLANGPGDVVADDETTTLVDIEQTAMDQISRLILAKFKGHGLATLVKAILEAPAATRPRQGWRSARRAGTARLWRSPDLCAGEVHRLSCGTRDPRSSTGWSAR